MPGVADCAVFGIPDDEFGEALAAAVQPAPGATLTPDAVRAWLHGRIAGYKVPRRSSCTTSCRARTPARSSSASCANRTGRGSTGASDLRPKGPGTTGPIPSPLPPWPDPDPNDEAPPSVEHPRTAGHRVPGIADRGDAGVRLDPAAVLRRRLLGRGPGARVRAALPLAAATAGPAAEPDCAGHARHHHAHRHAAAGVRRCGPGARGHARRADDPVRDLSFARYFYQIF